MSEAFIRSQIKYYTSILGCGNWHDRNLIVAQLHYYEGKLSTFEKHAKQE